MQEEGLGGQILRLPPGRILPVAGNIEETAPQLLETLDIHRARFGSEKFVGRDAISLTCMARRADAQNRRDRRRVHRRDPLHSVIFQPNSRRIRYAPECSCKTSWPPGRALNLWRKLSRTTTREH